MPGAGDFACTNVAFEPPGRRRVSPFAAHRRRDDLRNDKCCATRPLVTFVVHEPNRMRGWILMAFGGDSNCT
eukprot:6179646-Pleurochrysis_carterae.AAC.1